MTFVKTGEEPERFHDADFVRECYGLKSGANFVLEGVRLSFGIVATDDRGAAVGVAQALQDFDGTGFPGAVGAKQSEDFTFENIETDSANGFHVAVALEEIFHSYDGFGHKQELQSLQQTPFLRQPSSCRDQSAPR